MKIFICTNENQLIAAQVSKNSILKRSSVSEKDISIVMESEVAELSNFHSKPYLRDGRKINPDINDMQSFTLLRFLIPELMNYEGKALVLDPDIFLVKNGLEKLEHLNFGNSAIFARKGLKKDSWGSSVLFLSCDKLKHWSLRSLINELHQCKIDYSDLINLRYENSVSPLETKWNEFDEIRKDTILLHTTERLTQPWRAGLKLNSSIEPILKFIPRAPIYKFFGKDLTVGREHPSKDVTKFFFKELSECISKGIIKMHDIDKAIAKNFLRHDLKDQLKNFSN